MSLITGLSIFSGEATITTWVVLAVVIIAALWVAKMIFRAVGAVAGIAWTAISLGLISTSQIAGLLTDTFGR